MGRTVNIGVQSFSVIREGGAFYVDKTGFIREWWDSLDAVTLVCRPRRFGKTLNLSMLECFFSKRYAGRGEELFGGLQIWDDARFRELQGALPVVSLTFSDCKGGNWETARAQMCTALSGACRSHAGDLAVSQRVDDDTKSFLARVSDRMDDATATTCLKRLCEALEAHHGAKPIVLLDEYDTPMQEAWAGGWWDEAVSFQRSLFNATFKACPALGRGLITGVTRLSRESIFSDLNNLAVVTTTTNAFETAFGFTEGEVFAAMDEMGLPDRRSVREWYDGFQFGGVAHVYNPWSIVNYLKRGVIAPYWANSAGNALVSRAVRTDPSIQSDFEILLAGGTVTKTFDEQVVFGEIGRKRNAVWSLLLASGYLKLVSYEIFGDTTAELALTNREVRHMMDNMVADWFDDGTASYSEFVRCLLSDDVRGANRWLSDVLAGCISSFDGAASGGGRNAPENFYHGLVLGLLVELRGRYEVTSNRESGYGRYDVMLFPLGPVDPAFVIEFKVLDSRDGESVLADTLASAKAQIAERGYARQLVERGVEPERIRELGFAFSGKDVLVG